MTQAPSRAALRAQLQVQRRDWLTRADAQAAPAAVARQLLPLLQQLEPLCLGLYWPLAGEFDAPAQLLPLTGALAQVPLALPFTEREPPSLRYRRWNGEPPHARDGMGIPSSDGAVAEPDVVLVPCLGFTREGFRLGYGGGFFDRWLSAHPGVTAVGLAWSVCECTFSVESHDQPLPIVVTEREVLAP